VRQVCYSQRLQSSLLFLTNRDISTSQQQLTNDVQHPVTVYGQKHIKSVTQTVDKNYEI